MSIDIRRIAVAATTTAALALSLHAASAPASVLYDADASSSYADEWVAGNAFDIRSGQGTLGNDAGFTTTTRIRRVTSPTPPSPHTYAWQTTVEDGDVDYYSSDAQRTEMGMGNPTRVMPDGIDREQRQGDVRFIAYNLYIPSGFYSDSWCALNQNKGNGSSGNGPLTLSIWRGRLDLRKSLSQTTTSETTTSVWLMPRAAVTDRWIKILIEVKWSTGSDGYYALHGDLADGLGFRTLLSRVDGWTLKNNITVHSRLGIYRSAVRGTHSVYWAGFNVADTRADATTFAFGSSL